MTAKETIARRKVPLSAIPAPLRRSPALEGIERGFRRTAVCDSAVGWMGPALGHENGAFSRKTRQIFVLTAYSHPLVAIKYAYFFANDVLKLASGMHTVLGDVSLNKFAHPDRLRVSDRASVDHRRSLRLPACGAARSAE